MSISVAGLSVDAADAGKTAQFWAEVLGRQVNDGASPQFAAIGTGDAAAPGPRLIFHQVPEGKTVKNRLHLDLTTSEFESESERLLSLGATRVRNIEEDGRIRWTTFADPEGNEFDLINAAKR
jgi:predicted enzyme related to lactoylglutathione lyase